MFKFLASLLVFVGFGVTVATVETSFTLAFIGVAVSGIGAFIAHIIDRCENPHHYPPKH